MNFKFFVLHPIIHCPDIYAKAELEVNEDLTWNSLKEEVLSKLLKRDYNRPPVRYEHFSFVINTKPTIGERLRSQYGLHEYAHAWYGPRYGLKTQESEVAETFVRMMRHARVDGDSTPSDLRMKEADEVFVSIDVDFATRCPTCEKTGTLGFVYHPIGTDYAFMYTCLEVSCPNCGLRRTVSTIPPVVSHIHDSPQCEPKVFFEPRSELIGTQFERARYIGSKKSDTGTRKEIWSRCALCTKPILGCRFCKNCGATLCLDGSCRQEQEKLGKCPRCGEPNQGGI